MKMDWSTKAVYVFLGSGLWAIALMHGTVKVSAQEPAAPDVIKAQKFLLTNDKGVTLGEWKINKFGMSSLSFYDTQNKPRAEIMLLSAGSPGLFLSDAQSEPKAALMVFKDGAPGLALYDSKGTIRVGISTEQDGKPIFSLNDADGNALYKKP
jgi:hypothetical protein